MSSPSYITLLGRQPELSLLELESKLGAQAVQPFGAHAAFIESAIDIHSFGGIIRTARVISVSSNFDVRQLQLSSDDFALSEGKTPFAVSVFGGASKLRDVQILGLELKKQLKFRGSVRLILPQEGAALSAAGLKYNHVLEKGFEVLIIHAGNQTVIARTLAVQDIDDYAHRDHGRPSRSAQVGMLPPKLAQMMINTVTSPVIADPFCGTGVILQEARLLRLSAWGADISGDMVSSTQTNMAWLESSYTQLAPVLDVTLADARQVTLPPGCAVVSEGYLGPNFSIMPNDAQLDGIIAELLPLYRDSLKNWHGQLDAGGEVTLCAPVWRTRSGRRYLGIVDELQILGYTLKSYAHVKHPIVYSRSDAIVGRHILLLRKT